MVKPAVRRVKGSCYAEPCWRASCLEFAAGPVRQAASAALASSAACAALPVERVISLRTDDSLLSRSTGRPASSSWPPPMTRIWS
eukprot:3233573-Prymnesium_polylepis.2